MKKPVNAAAIVAGVGAVCAAACATVLVLRGAGDRPGIDATVNPNDADTYYSAQYESQTAPTSIARIVDDTTALITRVATTAAPQTAKAPSTQAQPSTAKAATTKAATTKAPTTKAAAATSEATTQARNVLEDTENGKSSVDKVIKEEETGTLPADVTFAGLYRAGYDVIGTKKYIYNNDTDPNCLQRKFGYNPLYDAGANLIDFSIETCRLKFNYDSKAYMIQIWKGQYISGEIGTVGGEVGIYTRPQGKISAVDHYDCADESDWLNMEMTVLWDENGDGNYAAQLTRNYDLHWWETGYVDGQLAKRRDSSPLRILSRITFKDATQAAAFESALTKAGFTAVATFNPTVKDTCKRYGKDVIFVWQDVR